jgi:type I restriction enzyme R subunit
MDGLQYFDRKQDFTVTWKSLPHWSQAGTLCFITWRTGDSLPRAAQVQIAAERRELLSHLRLNPRGLWRSELAKLPPDDAMKARRRLFAAWDRQLDLGAGECVLARSELSQMVEDSLRHFDGDRYLLTDSVVMPNHVHVLVAFADQESLISQPTSWKKFTGRRIQQALGRSGEFWQVEQFDHLVRSPEQFEHLRKYIALNPVKAGLGAGSYRHYSKEL